MKKLLMSVACIALVGSIVPADAASTLAIGGGLNFGQVQTGTAATSTGSAAAGSLASGTTTNIGAGFAAATPAGSISTGLGASVGQSNAVSGAARSATARPDQRHLQQRRCRCRWRFH